MISVSDTGAGMPPEILEKVFEPFFTTKGVGKGTGLGLSMVYGFVQRSGGHVKIYSEVGEGTSVHLYLPRARKGAEGEKTSPPSERNDPIGGDETILVVDDEKDLVDAAVSILGSLGYRTVTATNGKEALEILRQDPSIALLFTDVIMPGDMDGYHLAIAALKDRPDRKLLLTSGLPRKRDEFADEERQIVRNLMSSLLHKPYNIAELATAVRRAIDQQG
jgi:CheY-like chemotaxis protein